MALTSSTEHPIGPYWVDDLPLGTIVVTIEDDGQPADLTQFAGCSVSVRIPSGTTLAPGLITAAITNAAEGEVTLTWGSTPDFDTRGVYRLLLKLNGTGQKIETVSPLNFVVQDGRWLTLEAARDEWADAPYEDEQLYKFLDIAQTQIVEYAPVIDPDVAIPANLLGAQLSQARALWTANRANQNDQLGSDAYPVRVFPMDWTIKNMIRPKRGIGVAF